MAHQIDRCTNIVFIVCMKQYLLYNTTGEMPPALPLLARDFSAETSRKRLLSERLTATARRLARNLL